MTGLIGKVLKTPKKGSGKLEYWDAVCNIFQMYHRKKEIQQKLKKQSAKVKSDPLGERSGEVHWIPEFGASQLQEQGWNLIYFRGIKTEPWR